MRYLLLLAVFPLLMANQCSTKKNKTDTGTTQKDTTVKDDTIVKDSIPACLRQKLTEVEKNNPRTAPIKVDQYLYKNKTVYLFTADCCDNFNGLYDDSCRMICAPSGGITGKGDGKCPEFNKDAVFVKQVWAKKTGN
jgi:hypothetical protein